jgi:hypothetical protein
MSEASTQHPDDESVKADTLRGAQEIADEIGVSRHRIYKLWQAGRLVGAWKDGRDIFASKRAIRRAHHNRARTSK